MGRNVVDDEHCRSKRIDPHRVSPEALHGLTHRGQVNDTRDSREVLHDHPGGGELNLCVRISGRVPRRQRLDVSARDVHAILGAEQILQKHLQRVRQMARTGHGRKRKVLVVSVAHVQSAQRTETIALHGVPSIDQCRTYRSSRPLRAAACTFSTVYRAAVGDDHLSPARRRLPVARRQVPTGLPQSRKRGEAGGSTRAVTSPSGEAQWQS